MTTNFVPNLLHIHEWKILSLIITDSRIKKIAPIQYTIKDEISFFPNSLHIQGRKICPQFIIQLKIKNFVPKCDFF